MALFLGITTGIITALFLVILILKLVFDRKTAMEIIGTEEAKPTLEKYQHGRNIERWNKS